MVAMKRDSNSPAALRTRVIAATKEHFARKPFRTQLRWMADNYRSFEGWLNWEVAYGFALANRWPQFTAERESRYEDGGLADVRFYAGPDGQPTSECHLETKLIWNNDNRSKMLTQAAADAQYLTAIGGANLLLAVTVSANEPKLDLRTESPDAVVMSQVRQRLGSPPSHVVIDLDTPTRGARFDLYPRVRAELFEIG